jgi:hypothetical protein
LQNKTFVLNVHQSGERCVAKAKVSNSDLAWIFAERLREFEECPPRMAVAIVPDAKAGWSAIVSKQWGSGNPLCQKRIETVQKQLRGVYRLADD